MLLVASDQNSLVPRIHRDKSNQMNLHPYVALAGAIFFELIGTSFLQASQQFSRPFHSVATVVSFAMAIYLLSIAIKTIPVGIAYATWSGIGIALITGVGLFIFKQKLDLPALVGIAFITVGAVLITGFSQSKLH